MIKQRRYTLAALAGLLLALAPMGVRAQQEPLIGQYMFNPYLINPAFAGSEGYTFFTFTASNQWAGYSKSPKTYIASFQTSQSGSLLNIFKSGRGWSRRMRSRNSASTGIGAMIYSDWNGDVSRNGFQGTYAYHTPLRGDDKLSFGLSFSLFQFRADVTNEDLPNPDNDPLLMAGKRVSQMSPEANFGAYYTNKGFFAGFTANNLLQSAVRFAVDDKGSRPEVLRHYYLMGGYKMKANYRIDVEPSMMLTTTERGQFNTDINIKGYYKNDYWAGLSYRTSGAVLVLVGAHYQDFRFGYAFNFGFGDVSTFSKFGSHEFMVGYSIGESRGRYRWTRRR
ncbi:type IX secretion system membrane protein PorP/SprF [uncultured Acetobacteroides sp.]|uniref:PorP/SprF family type IX secretion system membrane protein n=1 Tax=uncultured Acetobacteroides sp. TaxID=1760811 RepID=UPI0029F4DDFA|nr:type IX secretion system membrane protein PorP/SprF [uncultured Acetobacteroides sp.]